MLAVKRVAAFRRARTESDHAAMLRSIALSGGRVKASRQATGGHGYAAVYGRVWVDFPYDEDRDKCFSNDALIALQSRSKRASLSAGKTDEGSVAIFCKNSRDGRVL